MKLDDIAKKSDQELAQLVTASRQELAQAVVDGRTKEVRDTKQIGRIKKTIARALTIAREREIAQQEQAS